MDYVTVEDFEDKDITIEVKETNLDITNIGNYTVTYLATDPKGLSDELTLNIKVIKNPDIIEQPDENPDVEQPDKNPENKPSVDNSGNSNTNNSDNLNSSSNVNTESTEKPQTGDTFATYIVSLLASIVGLFSVNLPRLKS